MIFKLARKTLGCLFSLLFFCLLLVVGLAWVAWQFVPDYLEYRIEKDTGFDTSIGDLELHPLSVGLELSDATIKNSDDFPEPEFISLRLLKADFNPGSLLSKRLLVEELVIDIEEFGYVTASNGHNNAGEFIDALRESIGMEESAEGEEPQPFLIERLVFRLEKVKLADYSLPEPKIRVINTRIDLELEGVTDVKDLIKPLSRELTRAGLSNMVDGFLRSLLQLGTYRDFVAKLLGREVESVEESAKSAYGSAEEAGEVIKNVVENLDNE